MKKAIDQTVRDLKRGVNKKVLKVPAIEQKVLDATSNESWGPHGSLLADIAQASRNYHEYQIIMSIIWKRINDTGKNWRHVYKALIVLEYLIGHGSERVIDDIREHAYQISALSDFQYIDHNGKDQGNNVRRKSQSLVVLVNDKERIQEVREKAAANRDKYRGPATSGMYRPGSGGYGDKYNDDRYGNRDDDRSGNGRDRDWGSRDDDRYGRYGDSYGRDGERYGRDSDERYRRDGYRDDDYRGRGQTIDEYNYNSRSRSADRERDRPSEDDGQFSSRGSGAKADDHSQDGRLDRKSSDQNPGAPPAYEDAVGASHTPTHNDRDGDSSLPNVHKVFPPPGASPGHTTADVQTFPTASAPAPGPALASASASVQQSYSEVGAFDEFDPRGSFSAAPATSSVTASVASGVEMDFLGSLSESFSSNALALVPSNPPDLSPEDNGFESATPVPSFAAAPSPSTIHNQSFEDPFGDGPFKATLTTENASFQPQITTAPNSINSNSSQSLNAPIPPTQNYMQSDPSGVQPEFPKQFSIPNQEVDVLADILPLPAPSTSVNVQASYPLPPSHAVSHGGFPQTNQFTPEPGVSSLTDQSASPNNFQMQTSQPAGFPIQPLAPQQGYHHQRAPSVPQTGQTMPLSFPLQAGQQSQMGFGPMQLNAPHANFYGANNSQSMAPASAYTNSTPPQLGPQQSSTISSTVPSNSTSTALAAAAPQPSKDKFETKSGVWADTLSRGLVNLNISGPKTNPLADIGVDFDAINRKEKRMEKPTSSMVTSTVTMGKAMGSGSGMGRTAAGALRAPPSPMMNPSMNMSLAGGPGAGIGMGGYGVSQPMGRGMGMSMTGNMGMGMNRQQPIRFPSGSVMQPGGYNNPMMGTGNYVQQPYTGGYQ